MGASFSYNIKGRLLANGNLTWGTDTIRAMLVTKSYNPDVDHDFVNSGPAANEASGGNYARLTLANATVTLDDANDRTDLDGDDLTFGAPTSGLDVIGCVLYRQVGADDTTPGDDEVLDFVGYGGGDIVSVDTTNDEFVVDGDETGNFSSGDTIEVYDHSTHNGTFTLSAAPSTETVNGDTATVLPIGTDLTDGTVQGQVFKIIPTDGNQYTVSFATGAIARLTQPRVPAAQ